MALRTVVSAILLLGLGSSIAWSSTAGPMALLEMELDGNAVTDNPAPGLPDDWDRLYNGTGHEAVWTGVLPDPAPSTIFALASKDIDDIPYWAWADATTPDKAEMTNAYACVYGSNTCYFGADRYGNVGDAYFGIWLLQDQVGLNLDGTFSGSHTIGDILLLATWYQMGGVTTPRIFEWVGSGGSEGSLNELPVDPEVADIIVNALDTPSPWPYTPKYGTPGVFPIGSFIEGGIDLTAYLGDAEVATLLVETRGSPAVTAELKDFVLTDLPPYSGLPKGRNLPGAYSLGQVKPNPFSGRTVLSFDLPEPARVNLKIYDVHGRVVKTLTEAEWQAGCHSVAWRGDSDAGQAPGPGVYFVRIEAGSFTAKRKLLLLE
jgi:hypothetical protein